MRVRHILQGAIITVLATTSLAASAADWPEKDITTENITRVTATMQHDGDRGIGASGETYRFFRNGQNPKGWFEARQNGGSSGSLLEETRDANSITIKEGPRRFVIDLVSKTISGATAGKPITGTISDISADAARTTGERRKQVAPVTCAGCGRCKAQPAWAK